MISSVLSCKQHTPDARRDKSQRSQDMGELALQENHTDKNEIRL